MSEYVNALIYRAATGEITRNASVLNSDAPLMALPDEAVLIVPALVDANLYYVDIAAAPPVVAERVALPAPSATSVAVDEQVVWAAIPGGSRIVVTGAGTDLWTHDAGDVEISFAGPGVYTVRILAPIPWRTREDQINVNA